MFHNDPKQFWRFELVNPILCNQSRWEVEYWREILRSTQMICIFMRHICGILIEHLQVIFCRNRSICYPACFQQMQSCYNLFQGWSGCPLCLFRSDGLNKSRGATVLYYFVRVSDFFVMVFNYCEILKSKWKIPYQIQNTLKKQYICIYIRPQAYTKVTNISL